MSDLHRIEKPSSLKVYAIVYAILMVLLAATVFASQTDLGALATAVALVIATVKALLIGLYFMHLRDFAQVRKLVIAVFVFIGIVMVIAVCDYFARGL